MTEHEEAPARPAVDNEQSSPEPTASSTATGSSSEVLAFHNADFLKGYLPEDAASATTPSSPTKPYLTLTYAVSLDSALSIAPGQRTVLSGPESKAMTHFLRSKHDAILIGVGTAVTDDPGLNCRLDASSQSENNASVPQPRPIVLDPHGRWNFTAKTKVFENVRDGKGKAPWVMLAQGPVSGEQRSTLEGAGGEYLFHTMALNGMTPWSQILEELGRKRIRGVMVEGGGKVVNDLLAKENVDLIDSVIITVAPTYLGKGGVVVSPPNTRDGEHWVPSVRFSDVKWHPLGEDVVMCAKVKKKGS